MFVYLFFVSPGLFLPVGGLLRWMCFDADDLCSSTMGLHPRMFDLL